MPRPAENHEKRIVYINRVLFLATCLYLSMSGLFGYLSGPVGPEDHVVVRHRRGVADRVAVVVLGGAGLVAVTEDPQALRRQQHVVMHGVLFAAARVPGSRLHGADGNLHDTFAEDGIRAFAVVTGVAFLKLYRRH